MTMLECCARAMAQSEELWLRQAGDARDGLDVDPTEPINVAMARAVLQALREPDEAMLNAAWDTDRQNIGEHGNTLMPEPVWQAMIDQVLDDDETA